MGHEICTVLNWQINNLLILLLHWISLTKTTWQIYNLLNCYVINYINSGGESHKDSCCISSHPLNSKAYIIIIIIRQHQHRVKMKNVVTINLKLPIILFVNRYWCHSFSIVQLKNIIDRHYFNILYRSN